MSLKKFQQGFIDPFSLLSLGFLLVTLVVMTVVTSNSNITQDIRKQAKVIEDSGPTVKKPATKTSTTTEPTVTTEPAAPTQTSPEETRFIQQEATKKPSPTPSPKPTPTPTPVTITKSDYQKCLDSGNSPSECQSIASRIGETVTTPAGTKECTPETKLCSGSNLKICSNSGTWGLTTCQYGCASNACKSAPALASTAPTTPIATTITKSDYQKCLDTGNTPSECQSVASRIGETVTTPTGQKECTSGQQQCSGSNLKICSNSGTWGLTTCSNGCENNACKPAPPSTSPSNTALVNTYNVLNTVTFGTFGNYVQTYQDINAQNPQASYLQQALNPQGIAASAQLGVVLTAEGTIAVTGAQALAGGVAAATTTGQAIAAYGGVYSSAIGSTLLSSLPTTVQTTIAAVSPYVVSALTIGSTIPAVVQTTQCLAGTGNCEQAQETAFYTAVGLQQMQDYQAMTTTPNQPKTVAQINREIDALVAKGTPELDAITQVGAASVPEYARTPEQIATLQLADKARTADEVLQCRYTWCRQNSIVSDAVLESRGYQPYRAIMTMQTTEGLSAGGHNTSAIFVNGEPVFIDFTSNLIIRGPQALEQIFINKGMTLNTLQLSTLTSPWEVINLLP